MDELTEEKCIASVAWAIRSVDAEVETRAFMKGRKKFDFLFAEHHNGFQDAGGTITAFEGGYNIDFDNRCSCCGSMPQMGSVDIDSPVVVDEGAEPSENVKKAGREIFAVLSAGGSKCRCNQAFRIGIHG